MPLNPESPLAKLMATVPQTGRVAWIGLRPAREQAMDEVASVQAVTGGGLDGDRYAGGSGKRGVTLIQAEHLSAIASLSGHAVVPPGLLRRNLVIAGIPLAALKDRRFSVGDVLLEGTGSCDPCSRMEAALGTGGYNAMRGHGGLCARIIQGGMLHVGDAVTVIDDASTTVDAT